MRRIVGSLPGLLLPASLAFLAALVLAFPSAAARAAAGTSTPTAIDLGTLGGTQSVAIAVNASGQVVGQSATAGEAESHAFSWTQAGGMVDLGTLGGTQSVAVAVNASGQVVGFSTTAGD